MNTIQKFVAQAVTPAQVYKRLIEGKWRWLYGEQAAAIALMWLEDVLADAPSAWTAWSYGRAFDRHSELTWWQEPGDMYTLQLLAGDLPDTEGIAWQQMGQWQEAGAVYESLLHGQYDTDSPPTRPSWSEARIPRRLFYPVDVSETKVATTRVVLDIQPYRQGSAYLERLLAVTTWQTQEETDGE